MPAFIDRTGKQYGRLTVVARAGRSGRRITWRCRCGCGREAVVDGSALGTGNTTSCGCMARGAKDETGKRYGRLAVVGRAEKAAGGRGQGLLWRCRCDCGKEIVTRGSSLRRGASASCGCLKVELARAAVMLPEGVAAMNQILRRTKANAAERGYAYSLTDDLLRELMARPCHYCGAVPGNVCRRKECNGHFVYNGIDRVDNGRGYTPDNVVPCCKHCNIAKRDRTAEEFRAWVVRLYRHFAKRR
jgi:hypothetical protein